MSKWGNQNLIKIQCIWFVKAVHFATSLKWKSFGKWNGISWLECVKIASHQVEWVHLSQICVISQQRWQRLQRLQRRRQRRLTHLCHTQMTHLPFMQLFCRFASTIWTNVIAQCDAIHIDLIHCCMGLAMRRDRMHAALCIMRIIGVFKSIAR